MTLEGLQKERELLKRIDTNNSLAIVIGVEKYDNLNYDSDETRVLFENGVRSSAQRISSCFIDELGFPPKGVELLESPSAETALRLIGRSRETELDAVIFYFCGHGILNAGQLYLGFRDLIPHSPQIGGSLMKEILTLLGSIRAKTKFIVLDCCFGGGGLEALPANFSQTDLRSEINLLGSFAVASAGKNVKALVPEASNYTAFSGTVCDVIEKGIEFAGALLSIDEVFREVRRIMLESSYPVPIRVSSIDDDLIALAPNRRFIPENEQLRFRINVMSERLQVYGRYFRQSNEYHRQAIQQLREQDSRVAALLETLKQSDAELAKQISSLKEFETSIRDLREQKADGRTVVRRIGWVYIAIIFGCALSIVASVVIVFNISNAT